MSTWFNVLPEAILSIAATLLLIVSTLANTPAMRDLLRWLSVFAVGASGVALVYVSGSFGLSPDGWLNATPFTTSVALVLLILIGWAILASPVPESSAGEWFALLLFAALGSVILARVANLPGLFLGIEVLSLALYVMVSFRYTSRNSIKGGAMPKRKEVSAETWLIQCIPISAETRPKASRRRRQRTGTGGVGMK